MRKSRMIKHATALDSTDKSDKSLLQIRLTIMASNGKRKSSPATGPAPKRIHTSTDTKSSELQDSDSVIFVRCYHLWDPVETISLASDDDGDEKNAEPEPSSTLPVEAEEQEEEEEEEEESQSYEEAATADVEQCFCIYCRMTRFETNY